MARRRTKPKAMQRVKAVLEEFAERADRRTRDEVPFVSKHTLYAPPWRERFRDGTLSDWWGMALSTFEEKQRAHDLRGFWDPEEDARTKGRAPKPPPERPDGEAMYAFMKACAHEVAARERELYIRYYVELMSRAAAASAMGLTEPAFRELHKRLKGRLDRWGGYSRCHPPPTD